MRIVQINSVCRGSTGKIARMINDHLDQNNDEGYTLFSVGEPVDMDHEFCCSNSSEVKKNALQSRIKGNYGFNSEKATERYINKLEELKPDIVHVHNIHGHDLNLETFFRYLEEKGIPVVITMHDCWLFTGYCPHYQSVSCDHFMNGCGPCPVYRQYSWFKDSSKENLERKKNVLLSLPDLTIVTPSQWLKDEVKKSVLKECSVEVIHNGIDLGSYHQSDSNVNDEKQRLILSVAFPFTEKKGFSDLMRIAGNLSEGYRMVLVGISEEQKKNLPQNVTGILKTDSIEELVKLYNDADVLVSASHEENFPTVNLEAQACGLPVAAYDVGGTRETFNQNTGIAVKDGDVEALLSACMHLAEKKRNISGECRKFAEDNADSQKMAESYRKLYHRILEKK